MKKTVTITQEVEIEIDETKFTKEFMSEFRDSFYNFKTLDDHIKHLAQLSARGCIGSWGDVPEGYDHNMLIRHSSEVVDVEIEKD
jgi:hypothetical protein